MTDDILDSETKEEMFKIVDAMFRAYAEERLDVLNPVLSLDTMVRSLWSLYEKGKIKLVADDDGNFNVHSSSRRERREFAASHRWLVEMYRRRQAARS